MKNNKKSNGQIIPKFARYWHFFDINKFGANPFIGRVILNTILIIGEQRQSQRFQVALPSDFFTCNQIYRIFRTSFPRTVVLVSPTVHFNFFKVGSNKRTSVYQPMAVKPLT